MSRAAKTTLALTGLGTAGIVWFVHWGQEQERVQMHKGVERDVEKQRIRQEREAEFVMQKALEEQYLKIQAVSPSTDGQIGGQNSGQDNAGQGT